MEEQITKILSSSEGRITFKNGCVGIGWEISLGGKTPEEIIERIEQANKLMIEKFGETGKKPKTKSKSKEGEV